MASKFFLSFFFFFLLKLETTRNGTLLNWSVKYLSPELSLGAIEIVGFPESAALSGVVLIKHNHVVGNQRQITVAAHCAGWCKAITQTRALTALLFVRRWPKTRPISCVTKQSHAHYTSCRERERDTRDGQICPHRRKVIKYFKMFFHLIKAARCLFFRVICVK